MDGSGWYNNVGSFAVIVTATNVVAQPPVLRLVTQSGSTLMLTWSALASRVYQVQFKTNLTQSTWTDLGSTIPATNTIATTSDAMGPDSQRFYRVVLLP